jgi:hypothetical protein
VNKVLLIITVLFFIIGCGEDEGRIRVLLTDAPPAQNVKNIYITVLGVAIRNAEGDIVNLQDDYYTVDIVRLAGGKSTSLTYNYETGGNFLNIKTGDYQSILLALAQINSVKIDSITDSLLIPVEYYPFTFELEKDITVSTNEYITLVVDLDASKSINWDSEPYELVPSFRILEYSEGGFVAGTVKTLDDTVEVPVKFALLRAANGADTITTLSDSTGSYYLFLPENTYNISAYAEGFRADIIYEEITTISDSILTGYDFILEEQ